MTNKKLFSALAAGALAAAAPAWAEIPETRIRPQQSEQSELDRFRAAVDETRRTLFSPGPRVESWDRGGVDVDSDLRALGADRFYLLNPSSSGPQIAILTDRPISDFVPAVWRVVDSYGEAGQAVENPGLEFAMLSTLHARPRSATRCCSKCRMLRRARTTTSR
jgi:hypothetical protein